MGKEGDHSRHKDVVEGQQARQVVVLDDFGAGVVEEVFGFAFVDWL